MLLEKYQGTIRSWSVEETSSCEAFSRQLRERLDLAAKSSWETLSISATTARHPKYKIASIDVPRESVHSIIIHHCVPSPSRAMAHLIPDEILPESFFSESALQDSRWVSNTHVTLAHFHDMPSKEMEARFGALVGRSVTLQVQALYWSDRVAALQVEVVPETDAPEMNVIQSTNSFVHITVWFEKGAQAYESNYLPGLVETKMAQCLRFDIPLFVKGTISLWPLEPTNVDKDASTPTDS
jgi:hypothetical protein